MTAVSADPLCSARAPQTRLLAVDATRTLAVLGMFTVHLAGVAADRWQILTWPRGYAAGAFAVLAGVALGLTDRSRGGGWRMWAAQVVRSAILFSLGVGLAEISTGPVVILCVYAALFLLLLPLRRLSGPAMLAVALAGVVLGPIVSYALRTHVVGEATDFSVTWATLTSPDAAERVAQTLFLTGLYPLLTWLPLALAGWGAFRVGLLRPGRLRRLTAVAAALLALGFGGEAAIEAVTHARAEAIAEVEATLPASAHPTLSNEELAERIVERGNGVSRAPGWQALLLGGHHTGTTLELLQILGVAAGLLALFSALATAAGRLVEAVGWPGRIPLSVYSAHLVAGWALLELGVDELGAVASVLVLLAYVEAAFVVGYLWRGHRGPLEALLRAATAPFRRPPATPSTARPSGPTPAASSLDAEPPPRPEHPSPTARS